MVFCFGWSHRGATLHNRSCPKRTLRVQAKRCKQRSCCDRTTSTTRAQKRKPLQSGSKYPLGESNPCLWTENPMSWATRRRGLRQTQDCNHSSAGQQAADRPVGAGFWLVPATRPPAPSSGSAHLLYAATYPPAKRFSHRRHRRPSRQACLYALPSRRPGGAISPVEGNHRRPDSTSRTQRGPVHSVRQNVPFSLTVAPLGAAEFYCSSHFCKLWYWQSLIRRYEC